MQLEYIIPGVIALVVIIYVASRKSGGGGDKGYKPGQRVRGSIWFHVGNLGGNFTDHNGRPVPDNLIRHWLDVTKQCGLNAVALRVEGYIMQDNGAVDGNLATRVSWFLNECAARGLIVSLGVGSYWGRKKGSRDFTEGRDQYLNWWDNRGPITRYLKYVGKHWGSRPNVICTFNEMDHSGLGKAWKRRANGYYQILRGAGARYIGTSENGAWTGGEDILLMHNQRLFQPQAKPWGCDEPAGGDDLYKDSAIRNPARLNDYRQYFNRAAQKKASLIWACSWVNRHAPADNAVKTVFRELAKR